MSVTVVGIGADGWPGLTEPSRAALSDAETVLGATRQLDLLPASVGALRVSWPSPMMPALPGLLAEHGQARLAVLASGDPTFFGVGSAVARHVPGVRVLPHPSSLSLACARMGWAAQDVEVVSAVGRPLEAVRAALAPGRRLLVLPAGASGPVALAGLLVGAGYGGAAMTVLARLGADDESRVDARADDGPGPVADPLHVVAVACPPDPADPWLGRAPGLPDNAFDHDGQLTKREVRALTVAALRPVPGALLWDVGGGAGSVAIEWMRHHPSCRAVSVETRAERVARIRANATALGVPDLRVVHGTAPAALADLTDPGQAAGGAPDAVFVGGGVAGDGMLATCWAALAPGGRLVANAVTVEGETALAAARGAHGGEMRRLSVDRVAPVGRFSGWRAMAPVTQWSAQKGVTRKDHEDPKESA